MKETGRIKLKEIPFSRTFETGNGEELSNATGYAVQFDNEKTPLVFHCSGMSFRTEKVICIMAIRIKDMKSSVI